MQIRQRRCRMHKYNRCHRQLYSQAGSGLAYHASGRDRRVGANGVAVRHAAGHAVYGTPIVVVAARRAGVQLTCGNCFITGFADLFYAVATARCDRRIHAVSLAGGALKRRGGASVRSRATGQAGACITRGDCGIAGFAACRFDNAVAACTSTIVVIGGCASIRTAAVIVCALRDRLMGAGDVAGCSASSHGVYRTPIAVVATRRASTRLTCGDCGVAGLGGCNNAVAAVGGERLPHFHRHGDCFSGLDRDIVCRSVVEHYTTRIEGFHQKRPSCPGRYTFDGSVIVFIGKIMLNKHLSPCTYSHHDGFNKAGQLSPEPRALAGSTATAVEPPRCRCQFPTRTTSESS